MNDLLNDDDIGSYIDPVKLLEKTLKDIHADMLRLLFIIPNTNEVKEKVRVLMERY